MSVILLLSEKDTKAAPSCKLELRLWNTLSFTAKHFGTDLFSER